VKLAPNLVVACEMCLALVVEKIAAGLLRVKLSLPQNHPWRASIPEGPLVSAGRTTKLTIPLSRNVRVRGVVRKRDTQEPCAGLAISIYGPSSSSGFLVSKFEVKTDKERRFEVFLPPGPIELRPHAFLGDYVDVEWWGPRVGSYGPQYTIPDDDFEVDPIELVRTKTVRGRLVDMDGKPLMDWAVYA